MTDTELKAAFQQHRDAVYRFAWRMTGSADAAGDIMQDVFLALMRSPHGFDASRAPLRSYLLGVARNLSLQRFRRENRWDVLDEEQFAAEPLDVEAADVSSAVARAVGCLPPLQREVLILATYEELSLEEIAEAVAAEIGTVKSRLHRARENLRRMLTPLKPGRNVAHGTAK